MNLIDNIYSRYKNRRQKNQLSFNKEVERYKCMSENEFIKEYIEVKARYEHKKFMLTVITITIIITVVMEAWRYLYNILIQLLSLNVDSYIDTDTAKILVVTIIALVLFVALFILFTLTSNFYKLSKQKIFLEEVKTIRQRVDN